MLWTANPQGVWEHVNREWVTYTGVLGETIGFGFEEAIHPDDLAHPMAVWQSAVVRGDDYEVE